jgi:hypothetical protein
VEHRVKRDVRSDCRQPVWTGKLPLPEFLDSSNAR